MLQMAEQRSGMVMDLSSTESGRVSVSRSMGN